MCNYTSFHRNSCSYCCTFFGAIGHCNRTDKWAISSSTFWSWFGARYTGRLSLGDVADAPLLSADVSSVGGGACMLAAWLRLSMAISSYVKHCRITGVDVSCPRCHIMPAAMSAPGPLDERALPLQGGWGLCLVEVSGCGWVVACLCRLAFRSKGYRA